MAWKSNYNPLFNINVISYPIPNVFVVQTSFSNGLYRKNCFKCPIDNNSALLQVLVWRRTNRDIWTNDEKMTHIRVTGLACIDISGAGTGHAFCDLSYNFSEKIFSSHPLEELIKIF